MEIPLSSPKITLDIPNYFDSILFYKTKSILIYVYVYASQQVLFLFTNP